MKLFILFVISGISVKESSSTTSFPHGDESAWHEVCYWLEKLEKENADFRNLVHEADDVSHVANRPEPACGGDDSSCALSQGLRWNAHWLEMQKLADEFLKAYAQLERLSRYKEFRCNVVASSRILTEGDWCSAGPSRVGTTRTLQQRDERAYFPSVNDPNQGSCAILRRAEQLFTEMKSIKQLYSDIYFEVLILLQRQDSATTRFYASYDQGCQATDRCIDDVICRIMSTNNELRAINSRARIVLHQLCRLGVPQYFTLRNR